MFVANGTLRPGGVPLLLTGYGFGASFVALFMQLGGGIYTKAADVGADMIGKVEAGIPEDDHRNPAVIADLVGDNVGDCAGSMADVFESIAAEIIGTMILGAQLCKVAHIKNVEGFIFFPLVIHSFDLIVSAVGICIIRWGPSGADDPLKLMRRAYGVTAVLALIAFYFVTATMLDVPGHPDASWYFFLCGLVGVVTSYLLIIITQYYTDYAYGPVRGIAAASMTGHGTNIIAGISVGMESTALPVVVVCVALLSS